MSGLVGRKGLGPVGLVFLSLGAVTTLLPFYFMFVFSTHERSEIFSVPPPLWFGEYFLENVGILIQKIPFWINLGWSIYVGFAATALTLLFCSMAGFAFAAYNFRGKNALFALVMATMIIPAFLGMVPSFILTPTARPSFKRIRSTALRTRTRPPVFSIVGMIRFAMTSLPPRG